MESGNVFEPPGYLSAEQPKGASFVRRFLDIGADRPFLQLLLLVFCVSAFLVLIIFPFGLERRDRFVPSSCSMVSAEEQGKKQDRSQAGNIASAVENYSRGISNANVKYQNAKGMEKIKLEVQIKEMAAKRKELLISLMRIDPNAALVNTLTPQEQQLAGRLTKDCSERQITYEGTLDIVIYDFIEGTSVTYFTLITKDEKRISLHLANLERHLISGMTVRVSGSLIDSDMLIDASNSDNLSIISNGADKNSGFIVKNAYADVPAAKGVQNTLVVLVYFQDTAQPSYTPSDVYDQVLAPVHRYDPSRSTVNKYYKNTSYNKTSLAGDIYGWYQIGLNQSCDFQSATDPAIQAVAPFVDFAQYSRLLIIANFEYCGILGVSTIGQGNVRTPDGVFSMSVSAVMDNNQVVIEHELGHGLGVGHARFLDCGETGLTADRFRDCTIDEYGDRYDVMGATDDGQWNAPHRDYIGWFSQTNIQTVTANGTYTLEPIETATQNLKALKIQRAANEFLYVEYRQPIDDDVGIDFGGSNVYGGASVHIAGVGQYSTYLIDTTPPDEKYNIVILPGAAFTDPKTGAQISVTSATAAALTLNVTLGSTDFTAPAVSFTSPTADSEVSGSVAVSADVTDDSSGVREVYFSVIGGGHKSLGQVMAPPYTVDWDTTQSPNGRAQIAALAYDNAGNQTISRMNVLVNNSDPVSPSVALMSPAANSYFASATPITFSATASDDVGIFKVEFWKDTDVFPFMTFDALTTPSFQRNLPDGVHTIYAKAYDFAMNSMETEPITIYVGVAIPSPTSTPSSSPTPSPTPGSTPTPTPLSTPTATPSPTLIPTPTAVPSPSPPPIIGDPSLLSAVASCNGSSPVITFKWQDNSNYESGFWLDVSRDPFNSPSNTSANPSVWGVKGIYRSFADMTGLGGTVQFNWDNEASSLTVGPMDSGDTDSSAGGDQKVPQSGINYYWRIKAFNFGQGSNHVYPGGLTPPGNSITAATCP